MHSILFLPIITVSIKALLNHNIAEQNVLPHPLIGHSGFIHVHVKISSSTKELHGSFGFVSLCSTDTSSAAE